MTFPYAYGYAWYHGQYADEHRPKWYVEQECGNIIVRRVIQMQLNTHTEHINTKNYEKPYAIPKSHFHLIRIIIGVVGELPITKYTTETKYPFSQFVAVISNAVLSHFTVQWTELYIEMQNWRQRICHVNAISMGTEKSLLLLVLAFYICLKISPDTICMWTKF